MTEADGLAEAAQLLLDAAKAYGVPALRRELAALRLALEVYEAASARPPPPEQKGTT